MGLLLSNSDRFMLKFFLGSKEVGFYSLGYNLANVSITEATMLILLVAYPVLIEIYNQGSIELVKKQLTEYINLHLFVMVPAVFCFFVFSDDIVYLLFPKYIGAEEIMPIIAIGVFLYGTSFYLNKAFELTKQPKWILVALLISLIVNILVNIIFIPIHGTIAAAYSTIIAYLIYFYILKNKSKHYIEVFIDYNFLIKVTFNSVVFLIVLLGIEEILLLRMSYILLFIKIIIILLCKIIFE